MIFGKRDSGNRQKRSHDPSSIGRTAPFVLLTLLLTLSLAHAVEVAGRVISVLDGDTIEVLHKAEAYRNGFPHELLDRVFFQGICSPSFTNPSSSPTVWLIGRPILQEEAI
jgi:hypothetical protein